MKKNYININGKEIKLSGEALKEKKDKFCLKEEEGIDVSELFYFNGDNFSLINQYNKKQIMDFDHDGFQTNTYKTNRVANLKSCDKKAILVDCEFDDLKVGDFFRRTFYKNDWEPSNKLKDKDLELINTVDDDMIYAYYFNSKNYISNDLDVTNSDFKFQKVKFVDVEE